MLAARWKLADRSLCDALLARYSEPHRRYHTLQHLAECFAAFDEIADLAQHPADVELALWFHDAIYDTRRSDNEQRRVGAIGHRKLAGTCLDHVDAA